MAIKKIFNLNTPEISSPGNFIFTAQKFLNGFKHNNVAVSEINTLDDIEKYNDHQTCIFLSNHCSKQKKLLFELGSKLSDCVFICFHFNFELDLRSNMPFKKYIITGEFYQKTPLSSTMHIDAHNFTLNCKNWVPFLFASSANPKSVGNLKRKDLYDSVFIGASYKTDWVNKLKKCFTHISPPFLSENDRVQAYLSSRVCLGFHSDGNILNSCITERILEGLSYGCAVLSDNPSASEFTGGIVEYVSSFTDVLNFIEKCKDDKFFHQKQRDGYKFSKQKGLYYHQAKIFLQKIRELYG